VGAKRNILLVGKAKGVKPLGRTRRRCLYIIKIDLGEIEWIYVDWIDLVQRLSNWRAHVNAVTNYCLP
jgi:hypothetical protein